MAKTSRTLDFECALITGGAGGIGRAIAEELLKRGKKVILVGRTEKSLESTSKEIGATAYYILDTGNIGSIPEFIKKVTTEHPEVDCLINNAGVQKPLEFFGKDYTFDLDSADQEIDINQRGPMHLTLGFLPHFAEKEKGGVVMNVSSVLGFVPFSIVNPVYNGTKAWLHFWTMSLRAQLDKQGKNIRVVEIAPPQVETALHRDRTDPDDNKKSKGASALSIEEFMEEVVKGWEEDKDLISAGMGKEVVEEWEGTMGKRFNKIVG